MSASMRGRGRSRKRLFPKACGGRAPAQRAHAAAGGDHDGGGDEPAQRVGEVAHHERHRDHQARPGVQQHGGDEGRRGAAAGEQPPGRSPERVSGDRGRHESKPEGERDHVRGGGLVEPARLPRARARQPLDIPYRERRHREQIGREGNERGGPREDEAAEVGEHEHGRGQRRHPVVDAEPAWPRGIGPHRPEPREVPAQREQHGGVGVARREEGNARGAAPREGDQHPEGVVEGDQSAHDEQHDEGAAARPALAEETPDGLREHRPEERRDEVHRGGEEAERGRIAHGDDQCSTASPVPEAARPAPTAARGSEQRRSKRLPNGLCIEAPNRLYSSRSRGRTSWAPCAPCASCSPGSADRGLEPGRRSRNSAGPALARSVKVATNTRGGHMEATITLGPGYALPEEEQIAATYQHLLRRLSHQSVVKHFDAYADIDWDAADYRIDPEDPRWELGGDDVLGATAWYHAQPQAARARLGLHLVATKMKIGTQFENVLQRGLLEFAWTLPNGSPEFRYVYHEVIEEGQHSLMFQEFVNRTGFDVAGLGFWDRLGARRVVAAARRFPAP